MAVIFTEKAVIEADIDEVWQYFINLEKNGAQWLPGVSKVMVTPGGVVEMGSVIKQFVKGKALVTSVTEFSKLSHVTFSASQRNVGVYYTYTFVKEGESTTLLLLAEVETKGFAKLLLPFIKKAIKRADKGQLKKLQESFSRKYR